MEALELKNRILEKLDSNNIDLMSQILELIEQYENRFSAYELSDEQKSELDKIRQKHILENSPSLSLEELHQKFINQYGLSTQDKT